jgi:trehalose 6-phosphate synthase
MKHVILAILAIIVAVGFIAVAFTFNQVDQEEQRLRSDLQYRSDLLARSLRETIEPNFINKSNAYLQTLVEKFANRERFAGMAIYDNKDNLVAISSVLPQEISASQKVVTGAMDEDKVNGDFAKLNDKNYYLFAMPLHEKESVVGAVMIVQNADYIDARLTEIWQNNLKRLFFQISLLMIALFLIIRWFIFVPVRSLTKTLRSVRTGNGDDDGLSSSMFFRPLTKEVSNIRKSLLDARLAASEEARVNLEKLDSPWTAERLKQFVQNSIQKRTIVVVSNREPYVHTKIGNKINYYFPASGMVTAIEPVMQACGGTWIAHGSGDADRLVVDKNNRLPVPPDAPKYILRRLWLSEEEENGYYYGFSNQALYPLCLLAHTRPIFSEEDWEQYKKVNGKFAAAVLREIKSLKRPIILVQDFHLALLPEMIKKARPDAVIGLFWHIPWVSPESFSICPWKKEILSGMLGADLIGFHTQLHCNNFIETVGRELESLIDYEQFSVSRNEHVSLVKPFPASIAFSNGYTGRLSSQEDKLETKELLKTMGVITKYIGVGVDRLDYTKGILERLKAVEIFLRKHPTFKNNFTFIQIAVPSKSKIKKYIEFAQAVEKETERINSLFKTRDWKPIVLIEKHHSHQELEKFYKLADFCLVTSLHDGMNLVAKEYVAARNDEKGVLILSQFTGASRELKNALIVNPYSGEQTAEAIFRALEMTLAEQKKRMRKLRAAIRNHNVYRWSAELLKALVSLG